MRATTLTFFILVLFASCSFNGKFYHPIPITEPLTIDVTDRETGDTIYTMHVLADSLPPVFIDSRANTIPFSYQIENVLFKNSLETKLHGWFISPNDSIKPEVTLVFLHGNGGNIVSYLSFVFPFVKLGYQAFIFDYSGYGFSGSKPTRKSVLLDGNTALQYVTNRADVKSTKVVLYGQSLGGHLAATVAQQNQNLIDGVVIEGAFSSHKDIAAKGAGIFGRIFVKETYPAFKAIEGLNKPVLIIHSTEDHVIPFEMGKKLFDHANEPKDFMEIDQCHICGPKYYSNEISDRIKLLLQQN